VLLVFTDADLIAILSVNALNRPAALQAICRAEFRELLA
jgi:hypothetical protein